MRNSALKTCFTILILFVCSTTLHAIKIVHGPWLQNVGDREATIVFVSDSISVGWVEIAPADSTNYYACERAKYFDSNIGIKSESRIHSVKIEGLIPGTTYRYRIYAQEVLSHVNHKVHYGDTAATDVYSKPPLEFTTLDTSLPTTNFLVINDIHNDNKILEDLLDKGNVDRRDFVVYNGDMISHFTDEATFFDGFMDTTVERFASETPLYYLRGNHETRGPWASRFQDYVCPREENLYFTFQQGPVFFICLDTGEDKPDSDLEYYGITDYDSYRTRQAEWLQKVVDSDVCKNAPFRVVIAHIPPYDKTGNWHGNNEVRDKFVSILNGANVDLMLCAHTHFFDYHEPGQHASFPILTNSNRSCVAVEADRKSLSVTVIERDGTTSFSHKYLSVND